MSKLELLREDRTFPRVPNALAHPPRHFTTAPVPFPNDASVSEQPPETPVKAEKAAAAAAAAGRKQHSSFSGRGFFGKDEAN